MIRHTAPPARDPSTKNIEGNPYHFDNIHPKNSNAGKVKLRSVLDAAAALASLGSSIPCSTEKKGDMTREGHREPVEQQPREVRTELQKISSKRDNKLGESLKLPEKIPKERHIPEHKKPTSALTFPEKLMNMMDYSDERKADPNFGIAWIDNGRSIEVRDPDKFTEEVLPRFFKHAKFSSFTRKLYRWGFRQVNRGTGAADPIVFANDNFRRDDKHLMAKMRSITNANNSRSVETTDRTLPNVLPPQCLFSRSNLHKYQISASQGRKRNVEEGPLRGGPAEDVPTSEDMLATKRARSFLHSLEAGDMRPSHLNTCPMTPHATSTNQANHADPNRLLLASMQGQKLLSGALQAATILENVPSMNHSSVLSPPPVPSLDRTAALNAALNGIVKKQHHQQGRMIPVMGRNPSLLARTGTNNIMATLQAATTQPPTHRSFVLQPRMQQQRFQSNNTKSAEIVQAAVDALRFAP